MHSSQDASENRCGQVHAFDAAALLVRRYDELLGASAALETLRSLAMQGLGQTFHSLQMLIAVTTYLRGTRLLVEQEAAAVDGGALDAGSLALFQQLCADLFRGLFRLASMGTSFGSAAGDVAAVEAILNANPRPMLADSGRQLPSVAGDVELSGVTFSYQQRGTAEGEERREVLREASLRFPAGQVTALVGRSGAGKSTVLDLVQRFYDVESGVVTLDGVPVRELDPRWLRRQVGKVEQEPKLFALSIADNIRLGRPTASDAEVEAAARRAGAHDFIIKSGGYDAMVAEQGASLSGGQRQRLAIARAILLDPPVLILDEASSQLDATTESEVWAELREAMAGRTVIVVAHRMSTIASADKIIVLADGAVCEEGAHAQLVAQGGLYAELVRQQQ